MAWTQSDVDAIKAAIASGTRRVTYSDRTVEYQSIAEMLAAMKIMQAEVDATAGNPWPIAGYASFGRGDR